MKQPKLKWTKIGENLKVAKWTSQNDIRTFSLRGHKVFSMVCFCLKKIINKQL